MEKSDIFNVKNQKSSKVSARDSNTFKHSNIFDEKTIQNNFQKDIVVPEILSKSHIFQENNLNININPPPVRNTNTYISCLPIDHSPQKAVQQNLFDKKKRPESSQPYKDNISIQKNEENVKIQVQNLIKQQIPKPLPRPQTQIPLIDPHEKRYKELHAGGVQDKAYEYSQQQSDLRSEQYFHNAQWWNESANPCQVNENAKFSTDYAFERKVQQNQSSCFPQQLKKQQSQKEAHQSKNLMDNKNSQNRKDNHNFSDLFDCPHQVKGQKQKPSGELMPNNLNFNQHDSNLYKKDYGKNSDQAQNNCAQRYFNNLKSDLDNHNYEAEFIKGKKVNPVKIEDILKDENYVPPPKVQIKKQENIEPVQDRVSLFRQKQNQQDKDMKVYEFEVKGVSQKFDMKLFKKIANDHGYSVMDFKTNTNKSNSGRGTIVVRNNIINPDSIDEIQKFLQSQGIIIVKQSVQGVLQSNNMVKNTQKNNQNKNPNKPGSKASSSKNVEIGSGSNINQEI